MRGARGATLRGPRAFAAGARDAYHRRMHTRTAAALPFLLLALAFAAAPSCGGGEQAPRTAQQLWKDEGCVTCHGANGGGTVLAPSLQGKAQHWTKESLVAYLRDPVGYAKQDERLKQQMKGYSQAMPTYKMLAPAELDALAAHVLALK